MASSIASSPYSIASLIASDKKDWKKDICGETFASQTKEENSESVESGGKYKEAIASASKCSCFACTQPSAFSPFKNGLGHKNEIRPLAPFSNVSSLADYVYLPSKGSYGHYMFSRFFP